MRTASIKDRSDYVSTDKMPGMVIGLDKIKLRAFGRHDKANTEVAIREDNPFSAYAVALIPERASPEAYAGSIKRASMKIGCQ